MDDPRQLAFSSGGWVYYLSSFRFTDQDILRFTFTVQVDDQEPFVVTHQQRMWTED